MDLTDNGLWQTPDAVLDETTEADHLEGTSYQAVFHVLCVLVFMILMTLSAIPEAPRSESTTFTTN